MKPEIILQTDNARVRIMTLEAGESTTWHHHSTVTDTMVGLEGVMRVEQRTPAEAHRLRPGELCTIAVGRVHRVANPSDQQARYLLVQGGGTYDFIEEA